LTLAVAGAAVLAPLLAGCSSKARIDGAGTPSPVASAGVSVSAGPSGTAAVPGTSGAPGTKQPGAPTTKGPAVNPTATGGPKPTGTVSYGWVISTPGGSTIRVEAGRHLVNTKTDKAATKYLTSHGGSASITETPTDHVDVDLGSTKLLTVSATASATIITTGTGVHNVTTAAFLTYIRSNLAKPLAVSLRLDYEGAPRYSGPMWMLITRGSTVVAISQVSGT
jgi:hypothetical protein